MLNFGCSTKQVADVMDTVKYEKDEVVITQGDAAGQQFYILEHGTAVAEFETPQGIVQTIRTYSSGEHFGELSFLIDAPRAVTIRATSK
jgi:cAMP-dependent protein kinase regulator